MPIYNTLPENLAEVDVIVVGGGTSGCIVASRIASKDPSLRVLLIEYGGDNKENPAVASPLLWRAHLVPETGTSMYYMGKSESQLGGRAIPVAAGGILGGGSCVNLAIYSRPQGADYDAWGRRGWSADELRPFMNKAETYHGDGDGDRDVHGQNGPVHVSEGSFRHEKAEADFISAMNALRYPTQQDLQLFDSQPGVARSLRYVSPQGVRQDVATTYLHPRLADRAHPNLFVLLQSCVSKILLDEKRAVGVQYYSTARNTESPDTMREIKAKRLVVLCAGTLGDPGILQRSGIGSRSNLEAVGVPVVADVPGVGRGYHDHPVVSHHYKSKVPIEETSDYPFVDYPKNMGYLSTTTGSKLLGWNGFDATSKIRPTEAEAQALGSGFKQLWDRDHRGKCLATILLSVGLLGDPNKVPAGSHFSLGVFTLYPYSRGSVRITGPSPNDPLDFETGLLSDKDDFDIKSHIWAYKKQREVARRMAIFEGEVEGEVPKYPQGSKAAVAAPVPLDGGDNDDNLIEYLAEDDAAIEDWVRSNVTTCWHGLGTCKMGTKEEFGVVDEWLNVHDVQSLKVADLSIVPHNVGAHTCNTAMTIGEKAADIIIAELEQGVDECSV